MYLMVRSRGMSEIRPGDECYPRRQSWMGERWGSDPQGKHRKRTMSLPALVLSWLYFALRSWFSAFRDQV
jgi:hypothetical protein